MRGFKGWVHLNKAVFLIGNSIEILCGLQILNFKMQSRSQLKSKKGNNQDGSDFELSQESYQSDICDNQSQCLKREKKLKIKLRKQRIYKKMNRGSWSTLEEELFLAFLHQNRSIFEDREQRRSCKIFRKMRGFIKTRSHEQCRSHHQKYEQRFSTFDGIVGYLQTKVQEEKRILKKSSTFIPHSSSSHELDQNLSQNNPRILFHPIKFNDSENNLENPSRLSLSIMNSQKSAFENYQEPQLKKQAKIEETNLQMEKLLMNDLCKMLYSPEKEFILQIDFSVINSL